MPSEFEAFLDDRLAPRADQLNRRAKRIATLTSRLVRSVPGGDMKAIEAAVRDLHALPLDELLGDAAAAAGDYDYRAYLNGDFAGELEAACREARLPLEGHFPSYFVFPFPVRVDTDNPSVLVNKRRVASLRPSAVVAAIREEKDRLERSPFNATEFVGVLFGLWDRMNARASVQNNVSVRQPQRLKEVYKELVPFARWRRDYPESFFAFDVQRLLLSDVTDFDGWRVALDRGRSAAGALRLIDRDGQERLISTVHFTQVAE